MSGSTGVNAARGEVSLKIGDRHCCLCLTLGALAEMESSLGCSDFGELQSRLSRMSASDLLVVLAALLRGGGEKAVASGLAGERIDIAQAAAAVSACFAHGTG